MTNRNTLLFFLAPIIIIALAMLGGCSYNPHNKYCAKWGQYGGCSQWEYYDGRTDN